jgi:hypothetical protein
MRKSFWPTAFSGREDYTQIQCRDHSDRRRSAASENLVKQSSVYTRPLRPRALSASSVYFSAQQDDDFIQFEDAHTSPCLHPPHASVDERLPEAHHPQQAPCRGSRHLSPPANAGPLMTGSTVSARSSAARMKILPRCLQPGSTTSSTSMVNRVLPFDLVSARRWGQLRAVLGHKGADLQIAATLERRVTVVTPNVSHFGPTGVLVLDPFGPPRRIPLAGLCLRHDLGIGIPPRYLPR